MIQLTPRSRIEEYARDEYARHFGRANQEPVRTVNFGAVVGLMEDDLLAFRGRVYRSPPVSYADAVRLFELADRLSRAAATSGSASDQMRAIEAIQREAVRFFWRLVRPIDTRRFIPRIFLRNPFSGASPKEVDDLMGFFWRRQMTSSVRHRGQAESLSL